MTQPQKMKVIGFRGFSGSGKTTLVEQLVARLKKAGQRVSVVKHAHHAFDIDHEGKDSWRHRQAGAFEVVVASSRRLAMIREFEAQAAPSVHDLIAELSPCDWVLVEGFKQAALPKIEVWRASTGQMAQYPHDPQVVAICTDSPSQLPVPTALPVLDLNDAAAVAGFLLHSGDRYLYERPQPGNQEPGQAPGRPRIHLIFALARNGVIGHAGALPWHLPEDLAHFRRTTRQRTVLMGRRTWESLPERFRPLPGRRNIVLTTQAGWAAAGAQRCASLDDALAACSADAEVWVIGGAQLYAQALPLADRLVVTEIDADFAGDTRFPAWDRTAFVEVSRETHRAAEPNPFSFSFVTYDRRR
jgi:molybdopterin-guanine dinucleotide biosynthesis adapter protein